MLRKQLFFPLFLAALAFLAWFLYWKLLAPGYLIFSDSAKTAEIARNLALGEGLGAKFAFFNKEFLTLEGLFPMGSPPLYPIILAIIFKIFGAKDFIVVLTSGFFYLMGAIILYFLGKKLFSKTVGFLAALAFIFDPAILTYATSGASESLFVFELILTALLFYINTRNSLVFGFLTLVALYFTRPSAIIYIAGFIILFILLRFKKKNQILKAFGVVFIIWLLFEMILVKIGEGFFLYSPLGSFLFSVSSFSPLSASTEALRGGMVAIGFQFKLFLSKFLYNLYNFYKLIPQILSPYLMGFYLLSLLRWEKEREKIIFRSLVLFFILATFFAAAATLPIYRYLHPIIPFIYLLAVEMLVWIIRKLITFSPIIRLIGVTKVVFVLLFIFIIGQTTGKIFLDSRYIRARTNQEKPPVYIQLSWILKENTKPSDLIITSLVTWGSWYGERKSIWYPLEPRQLIPPQEKELKIDAIYLTSYKMDDESYYMGQDWRAVFSNPEELEDPFFAKNFKLAGKFKIEPEETYERQGATAILLIRK